jgi:hypothetical protein
MQAVMREMSGISELQSLNASPVHICCASGLKAYPGADHVASEPTNAQNNTTARIVMTSPVFEKYVIFFKWRGPNASHPFQTPALCNIRDRGG